MPAQKPFRHNVNSNGTRNWNKSFIRIKHGAVATVVAERVWARGFGALVACRYVFIDIFKFKCTNHFFFSFCIFKFVVFILIVFNIVNLGLYLVVFLKFNSSCLFLLVLNTLIMIEGH